MDLGRIHPGWSVGAIWTHQNCPRGSKIALKCHNSGISGHRGPQWLQMVGYQWISVGSGQDTSRMACWYRWSHQNCTQEARGWSELACFMAQQQQQQIHHHHPPHPPKCTIKAQHYHMLQIHSIYKRMNDNPCCQSMIQTFLIIFNCIAFVRNTFTSSTITLSN